MAGVVLLVLAIVALIWYRRRRQGPVQDPPQTIPAPYYAEYSQPPVVYSQSIRDEKSGQTILSLSTTALPEQVYTGGHMPPSSVPAAGPFNPYGAHSADSRTQSLTQLSQSVLPTTTHYPPSAPVQAQQPVDVDRIIELIAQRIDRAPPSGGEAPPQYPQSHNY